MAQRLGHPNLNVMDKLELAANHMNWYHADLPNGDHPFERLCFDLIFCTPAYNGDKYVFHSYDANDGFHMTWCLDNKGEINLLSCLRNAVEIADNYGHKTRYIHVDGEVSLGAKSYHWAAQKGVHIEVSSPQTPTQNASIERAGRTVNEKARTTCIEYGMNERYWPEFIRDATYKANRTPIQCLNWRTPIEFITGRRPYFRRQATVSLREAAILPIHKAALAAARIKTLDVRHPLVRRHTAPTDCGKGRPDRAPRSARTSPWERRANNDDASIGYTTSSSRDLVVYTDGSQVASPTRAAGAGWVICQGPDPIISRGRHPLPQAEVFDAEAVAALKGLCTSQVFRQPNLQPGSRALPNETDDVLQSGGFSSLRGDSQSVVPTDQEARAAAEEAARMPKEGPASLAWNAAAKKTQSLPSRRTNPPQRYKDLGIKAARSDSGASRWGNFSRPGRDTGFRRIS
ncbi:hypothetical protein Egran_02813 [Elaphomyces granulatus]|uniref:Integrase catalytic domain-containing protein n=1 Tax=Elaphomyces granulatus TaxID=519963 RepID=A0A232LZ29_9EURO|nr:hypothetical protein Egran_02813 [Elaphomyces granulatus]